MLKKLMKLLSPKRFARDEKGNVMILSAFAVPAMMVAGGIALDLGEMYRAKTTFQVAIDSAALAFAKEYAAAKSTNGQQLTNQQRLEMAKPIAEELFYANLSNMGDGIRQDSGISFDIGSGDCNTDGATATAYLNHEIYFPMFHSINAGGAERESGGQKVNVPENAVHLAASSTVRCNNNNFEIALVLDNSGSMRWSSRMTTLKAASSDLVNTMFSGSAGRTDEAPMAFSVVPFAGLVNVGSQNDSASWMDTNGVSPIHHEHFNWALDPQASQVGNRWVDTSGSPLTRFTLYDNLPGIEWEGCVEARPYPYHLNDEEPNENIPETMIVPAFAPDTPDNWSGRYDVIESTGEDKEICNLWQSAWRWAGWRWRRRSNRRCRRWTDNFWGQRHPQDFGYRPERNDRIEYRNGVYIGQVIGGTSNWQEDDEISEERYQNNYLADDHNFPEDELGHPRKKEFVGAGDDQYGRQKWTWKYFADSNGNDPDPRDVNNDRSGLPSALWPGGPNNMCRTPPITPLTADENTVLDAINGMNADGSTNIQQGVIWGWRTLSPQEPFSEGAPYEDLSTRKIMIVMSDGNNTYYPTTNYNGYSNNNKSFYGAWGLTENGRIFDGFDAIANPSHSSSTFQQAIDDHLVNTCENAKAAGIQIYTIAFGVANGSSVQAMLRSCATVDIGGNPLYFNATNNAALIQTFEDIQQSLSELRLSK